MQNKVVLGVVAVVVLVAGGYYFVSNQQNEDLRVVENQNITENTTQNNETVLTNDKKVLNIVATESKATYQLNEELRGTPTLVTGNTSSISGNIILNTDNQKIESGQVKLDASTFKTDIPTRDENVKKLIFKSDKEENKYIVFNPTNIEQTEGSNQIKVTGNLTISGVSKNITFEGTTSMLADGGITIDASTMLTYADFSLVIPDFPFLANVDKTVKISVSLVAR